MKEGILEGIIGLKNNLTFFTKYGWLFPWLAIVLSTVWSVVLVFRNPKAG
jgi:apolipoprotein N-acyltransferase